jgi:hypothetical protein
MAKNSSRSRAFFLELVINLLLFTLCAAVCLQVFSRAFVRSDESRVLAQATLRVQSVAEAFKSGAGDAASLAALVGGSVTEGGVALYYDADWAPAGEGEAVYRLDCRLAAAGPMKSAQISAVKEGQEIFALTAKKYIGDGGGR